MELSQAILRGCLSTRQVKYSYFRNGGTCALGAALIGSGLRTATWDFTNTLVTTELRETFPVLNLEVIHPEEKTVHCLLYVIPSLNDEHGWSRERIASWLHDKIETIYEEPTQAKEVVAQQLALR